MTTLSDGKNIDMRTFQIEIDLEDTKLNELYKYYKQQADSSSDPEDIEDMDLIAFIFKQIVDQTK